MGLRDIGAELPPGFRFYPSDEELVCHYLYKKISNEEVFKGTLVEIDLHTCEPWQLPEVAKLNSTEWYFFSFRDRKYATGFRTNRATTSGYWKATGKDRTVVDPTTRAIVGMRKTLVFYQNRAPNGIKTGWIMHEFRLENPHLPPKQEDWVLCRVFHKAKTENTNQLSPQDVFEVQDATAYDTSPLSNRNLPLGYFQQQQFNQMTAQGPLPLQNPNNLLQFPSLNPNHRQLSQTDNSTTLARVNDIMMMNSKCDDQNNYRFLFDMNFDDGNMEDVLDSNMRFDDCL
ncbi:Protein CUP-SHAPED COTYLEDON 3 [Heracleum sosnowskyi]|uniref:Protein CUP-SHAPED COTYLEDON 3 n=1 Tax=Heracleum sosnowskyi TaxID=360622 RepID=A0AAD8GXU4_9APIA|nr:Protein CUP-SHAPED COTYLEDON 3 [Heracleum sosnowskyi]